jgi:hypothetical protein
MVEEMMDLETCRFIDFPGVGVTSKRPNSRRRSMRWRRSGDPMSHPEISNFTM